MAGNSKFVLRWEIDNPTVVHAAGKALSKVFNEGGFEWKIELDKNEGNGKFALGCSLNQRRHWKCEGKMNMRMFRSDGTFAQRDAEKFVFDENTSLWCPQFYFLWAYFSYDRLIVNGKFILEFHIDIINLERGDLKGSGIFAVPNNKSNVMLNIGDEKLHVSKEDNSNFVLRWEIDNATAIHEAGKAESKVFNEGGFKWKIKMERERTGTIFTLECGLHHHQQWKCEGEVSMLIYKSDGTFTPKGKEQFSFNDDNTLWFPQFKMGWIAINHPLFSIADKFILEFPVQIISADHGEPVHDPARFLSPGGRSDVVLKIGDKKLHVSKEYLSVQSPVFEAMFFGDYSEKGKGEVEIKDVVYEEFVDLLNVAYLVSVELTDRTVLHVLKLADRFQMKCVMDLSQKYFMQLDNVDVIQKLIIADQYRLFALRDNCLKSFKSIAEWTEEMKSFPDLDFSDEMKLAIYNKITKLKLL